MTTTDTPTRTSVPIRAVPVRHWGRWATAVAVMIVAGLFLRALLAAPNLRLDIISHYLLRPYVVHGVFTTLWLTAVAMALGTTGGIVLAVMRLSANPVLRGVAWLFIWFFRGTPLLVQIIFWGFLGALFPTLSIGSLWSRPTSVVITGTVAAVLALSLNEMAYAAEIIRAGILSVDRGQTEAAYALGMPPGLTMRRIVLPQAMRVIIPPMGNDTITMLKSTALVSVIAGRDLLTVVQGVYSANYQVIPLLCVAALWYLAMTSLLSIGQYFIERRYGRGFAAAGGGLLR